MTRAIAPTSCSRDSARHLNDLGAGPANTGPAVLSWIAAANDENLRLSVITLGEIRIGAELLDAGPRMARIDAWLEELQTTFADRILPVDAAVALRWGALARRPHTPPIVSLLAATALCHGLTLATRNVGDFAGTGVPVVNPWEERVGRSGS